MSLPVSRAQDVALRLLRSAESGNALEADAEHWLRTGAAATYGALKSDPCCAIPAKDVRARFEASGPPVHDGPDQLHPRAQQQLDDLDEWITKVASPPVAQQFVRKVMGPQWCTACGDRSLLAFGGRRLGRERGGVVRTPIGQCVPPNLVGSGTAQKRREVSAETT